ncbi:zinc-ribbon domain-containing protein [Gaopeijia maritima]|uniref:zinc-ribbon domain-containing protein n=1 Tax=Gaopeijia maritima TaxID=3119007 RepID=UPI003250A247
MMIISVECPACHTSFPVDPRKVPEGGVKVRCSVCAGIFFVEKPEMRAPASEVAAVGAAAGAVAAAAMPADTPVADAPPESEVSVDSPAESEVSVESPPESDAESAVEDAPHPGAPDEDPWADEPVAEARPTSDGEAGWSAADMDVAPPAAEAEPAPPSSTGWDEAVADVPADDPEVADAPVDASFDPDGLDSLDLPESGRVDPWSGSGWEDEAETAPDPWSGGVELDAPAESEPAAESAPEPTAEAAGDQGWVIEHTHSDGMQPTDGPMERLDTVEEETRVAAEDLTEAFGDELETSDDWSESAVPPAAEAPVADAIAAPRMPAPDVAPPAPDPAPESTDTPEPEPARVVPPRPQGFQFGRRDPHDKAKRLARVLVSDIITYNPDRHQVALERNSLHADFEDEIKKSWAEYVEQVGSEIAESTPYWFDALNEILARGEKVF